MNSVVAGSQAAELFTFYVNPSTMKLVAVSTAAYASAFKIRDGYLKLDLSAAPPTD